jgi:hypothetical protein
MSRLRSLGTVSILLTGIWKKLWVEMYSYAASHYLESGLNLMDTVALLIDVKGWSMDDQALGLLRGQVGTVIETSDAEVVIVEFAGIDGVAYALASVACTNLLRLRHDKPVVS